MESGCQVLTVEDEKYLLQGNFVFVTQPGELHGVANSLLERCRLYFLSFLPPGPGQGLSLAAPGEELELARRLRSLPRIFLGDARMKTMFEVMLKAADQQGDLWRTSLQGAAQRLLMLVIERSEPMRSDWFSPGVRRAIQHVRGHLEEPLDVATLARVARLSTSRLHALFKRETGMPPRDYVLREKVEAAKRQLARNGCSITELGHALGFSSSQYFSTVFRRYTGLAPSDYIKFQR